MKIRQIKMALLIGVCVVISHVVELPSLARDLGVLGVTYGELRSETVLEAEEWAGSWHYGESNLVRAIGDFDNNGVDDMVVTSGWGIGIISYNGYRWHSLLSRPYGTRFGDWHFGWGNNVGIYNGLRHRGDFNGDGKDDILVSSGWGMGILTLSGSTLTTLAITPRRSVLGGWYFDESTSVLGFGDFNGDGKDDLLVSNFLGNRLGVLTRNGSTFTSLVVGREGSWFGGWRYGRTNAIRHIGDFNGDGKDDIVVTSYWGIGILTLSGSTFTSIVAQPRHTRFGNWHYGNDTRIQGVGDFNGDNRDDLLVTSDWGIGILTRRGSSLTSLILKPNHMWFGNWHFDSTINDIDQIVDLDGDSRDDIVVRSDWGIGVLKLVGTSFTLIDSSRHQRVLGGWYFDDENFIAGSGNLAPGPGKELLILQDSPFIRRE